MSKSSADSSFDFDDPKPAKAARKIKLPKWTDIYPQGTKEGDEEQRLFISLARNPQYKWRSVASLAKEANISKERTEQILLKYYRKKMVYQNPKVEDQWGYWERVPDMVPDEAESLSESDQKKRIKRAKG